MQRAIIRSSLFNLLFYGLTAIMCIVMLPTLALPRRFFMGTVQIFVRSVYVLERVILGLKYEIRGLENLPTDGSYIIAAKHQSAYETMKLHMLFKDPAVILKKELLSIPLWGLYLKKSDPIAIDRSSGEAAIQSIQDGARRMQEQGRPIVIFPQGTRVTTDASTKDKPYKVGVARLQDATGLPVIPMALNAGLFWPRPSKQEWGWLKSSGTVIFEFLKPIPAGLERSKFLAKLEKETEAATQSLMDEAGAAPSLRAVRKQGEAIQPPQRKFWIAASAFGLLAMTFILYTTLWFATADQIQREYPLALADLTEPNTTVEPPAITGYPGKLKLHKDKEVLRTPKITLLINDINAESWPIPSAPVTFTSGPLEIRSFEWDGALAFESLMVRAKYDKDILSIFESALKQGEFTLALNGTADLKQEPIPLLDMNVRLTNHLSFLQNLSELGMIEPRIALFLGAGLTSLSNEDGAVELPLYQKDRRMFVGPLPIMTLPSNEAPKREAVIPDLEPSPSAPDSDSLPAPSL